jgi:activator of 2-hydroxyglutaryl-CoA dehydratase
MLFDDGMKIWVSRMSGICAAGTGAFLDSVAARLNLPVEELAEHVNYDSLLEISSVCAVLSATSVNKFKNRYPLGDVIAAACRAQARTIVSGVGSLFLNYDGAIVFQGGVASNRAVAPCMKARSALCGQCRARISAADGPCRASSAR